MKRAVVQFSIISAVLLLRSALSFADPLLQISGQSVLSLASDGVKCEATDQDGTHWLRLRSTGEGNHDVTLVPREGTWDLSAFAAIEFKLRNLEKTSQTIRFTVQNPDAKGIMDQCRNAVELSPGEQKSYLLRLTRRPEDPTYQKLEPYYMYYKAMNVRDNTLDPKSISKLIISVGADCALQGVELAEFQPVGQGVAVPVPFFPFVDQYGQYIHSDWPGKIYSDADFVDRLKQEQQEQSEFAGPSDRDEYGGWTKGPQLKATGFFYAAKNSGKWWFVDPKGSLFWSYGPTGVGFGGDVSPITDREDWFSALPDQHGPFAQFYSKGFDATYRYYQKRNWLGLDIQQVNLVRKYGADYQDAAAEVAHRRLHSWGFNTIGNWSSPQVCALHKTPYTVPIHYESALIHFHMPDVYDPGWEPAVRASVEREKGTTVDDPWNLGYFVDNERWFGWRPRGAAIGEETMKNPPERKAKIKFVELLKEKYKTIDALNTAWKTSHASWEALLAFAQAPDMKNPAVLSDCGDFGMMFAERYFSVIHDIMKSVAPHNLYLGSRFFGHTDPELVKLASRYCDVIAYNIYDNPPDGRVNQYNKLDVPLLISEWGIGSDPMQTPFRDEKLTAPSPKERAAKMTDYLDHALRLSSVVGAHFFQYRDQPLSGRPDGEATLRGFVNVADTPNFELVSANRKHAYPMYEARANAGEK